MLTRPLSHSILLTAPPPPPPPPPPHVPIILTETPNSPEEFSLVEHENQTVWLSWTAPLAPVIKPVDEYVLQLSYYERGIINTSLVCSQMILTVCDLISLLQAIPNNVTSYVVDDLVPGVSYTLVLRSSNLAGLSPPTSFLSLTTDKDSELP